MIHLKKCLLLFLLPIMLFSQQKALFVYDKLNHEPLAFVNIKLYKNDVLLNGLYSNNEGKFIIENFKEISKIEFSSNGFERLILDLNNVISDTIFLDKIPLELNEVVLRDFNEISFKEVGYHLKKRKTTYSTFSGLETVVYIENSVGDDFFVKSVFIKILRRQEYKSAIRVVLYECLNDSVFPSDKILAKSEVYYIQGNSSKLYEFDLDSLNIEFPESGFFIGIEWIGRYDESNNIFLKEDTHDTIVELNSDLNKPYTFSRNVLNNKGWSNLSENLLKYTNLKIDNYPNASFGVKLYKL